MGFYSEKGKKLLSKSWEKYRLDDDQLFSKWATLLTGKSKTGEFSLTDKVSDYIQYYLHSRDIRLTNVHQKILLEKLIQIEKSGFYYGSSEFCGNRSFSPYSFTFEDLHEKEINQRIESRRKMEIDRISKLDGEPKRNTKFCTIQDLAEPKLVIKANQLVERIDKLYQISQEIYQSRRKLNQIPSRFYVKPKPRKKYAKSDEESAGNSNEIKILDVKNEEKNEADEEFVFRDKISSIGYLLFKSY